ncbi:MAG: GTPase/DUF3482 domain-containing protein [Planctomycetota bacterium]
MTEAVPVIAVVGRTNEGKTSVVAALTENDRLAIADAPGTTTRSERIDCRSAGEALFALYDTPGFEDAEGVLEWLQAQAAHAADHASAVAAFLETHAGGASFAEECELLGPVVREEAGIIYVVDGSHPFSPDFEAEMEVLRWTGRPRMALINPKAGTEHVQDWQAALDQYFGIVRIFDAHDAPWSARRELLTAFRELQTTTTGRERIDRAVAVLDRQDAERALTAVRAMTGLLVDGLTRSCEVAYDGRAPEEEELRQRLCSELEGVWRTHQRRIEDLYQHRIQDRDGGDLQAAPFAAGLFSTRTWELFGLSRTSLALVGAAVGGSAGAPIGGIIDLHTGGATFLAGTVLGSVIGGGAGAIGALFAGRGLGAARVLGQRLGRDIARCGPITNPRFAWILLDLAILHHRAVRLRSHARRDPFVLPPVEGKRGIAERLPGSLRRSMERQFARLRKQHEAPPQEERQSLQDLVQRAVTAAHPG